MSHLQLSAHVAAGLAALGEHLHSTLTLVAATSDKGVSDRPDHSAVIAEHDLDRNVLEQCRQTAVVQEGLHEHRAALF
jgi:hypothetical protein